MILYASKSLAEISKSLAPIPSVNYVHHRIEVKRKSDVVDNSSNSRMSPDLQLICAYNAHEDRKKRGDTQEIILQRTISGYNYVMVYRPVS